MSCYKGRKQVNVSTFTVLVLISRLALSLIILGFGNMDVLHSLLVALIYCPTRGAGMSWSVVLGRVFALPCQT